MVATKLREVATKGKDWMYSEADSSHPQSKSSWWSYATDSLTSASNSVSSMVSSLYGGTGTSYNPLSSEGASAAPIITSRLEFDEDDFQTPHKRGSTRRKSTSPWNQTPHSDLVWMFRNNKNPYNAVRGRDSQTTSMTAIRSLVALVPTIDEDDEETEDAHAGASAVPPPYELKRTDHSLTKRSRSNLSPSETASQLAEGTIRALRDLALDEAIELQAALRYWNYRWERPLLSWLEAGPWIWYSGYSHQNIGRRVSQIQAVLARRCAAVGELQHHLLKAGWHRGVAQWGVLGQWAAVAGFDTNNSMSFGGEDLRSSSVFSPEPPDRDETDADYSPHAQVVGSEMNQPGRKVFRRTSQAQVLVGKHDGEGIFVDNPDFLAEWSVESMRLVRRILFRASNGKVPLPCDENWSDGSFGPSLKTPKWAEESYRRLEPMPEGTPFGSSDLPPRTAISNLPLMVNEVEELLDIMEEVMMIQRNRRLNAFRPPGWLHRNWYIVAASVPSVAFLFQRINARSHWKTVVTLFLQKVGTFVRERLVDPLVAIFNEIWSGRESFSDKKAIDVATESLKKMLQSWLEETYPEMSEDRRRAMVDSMDITLLEQKKEESMKTFYEINNVVRMSFIEMQYMKKEMMNALHAMDEMMSANDINMNLAAITPFALLVWLGSKLSKLVFYAFLKIGTSREETYASLRNTLTDIERLLVMRDNPPSPPVLGSPDGGFTPPLTPGGPKPPPVLGSDDLGMLMLLVHECRVILRYNSRRFSDAIIRSVSEDLAELAGERGAVSVQQQLRIVERMCRTYPFFKVVSTGHLFEFKTIRHVK